MPTPAARIRVLSTGRSDKNDPNDALSVAIAALRTPAQHEVATSTSATSKAASCAGSTTCS